MCRLLHYNAGVWIALLCVAFSQPPAAPFPEPLPARPIAAWAQPIAAERPAPNPLDDETLDTWIHDYTRWRAWAEKWINRRQWVAHPFPYPFWKESPDLFSYVAPRRVEPEPPIGLEAACAYAPRILGRARSRWPFSSPRERLA